MCGIIERTALKDIIGIVDTWFIDNYGDRFLSVDVVTRRFTIATCRASIVSTGDELTFVYNYKFYDDRIIICFGVSGCHDVATLLYASPSFFDDLKRVCDEIIIVR